MPASLDPRRPFVKVKINFTSSVENRFHFARGLLKGGARRSPFATVRRWARRRDLVLEGNNDVQLALLRRHRPLGSLQYDRSAL